MKKYYTKIIIKLILIVLLIGIPTSVFAVDKSATIGDDLHFTEQFSGPIPYVNIWDPGDSIDHVMELKNESEVPVAIYFSDAVEKLEDMDLSGIIFSIYIDGSLYKRGTNTELSGQLIYVLKPDEEITIVMNVLLDTNVGNYYQGKEFEIEWTLGIVEYIEPEEKKIEFPKPIEPEEKKEVERKDYRRVIIGGTEKKTPKTPQTLTGQIVGYVKEKLDNLSGQFDNIIILIFLIVAVLLLIEFARGLRWLIILLANLRNTKIYVRVYNDNGEKFKLLKQDDTKKYKKEKFKLIKENGEEKFKLVKKIKTKNRDQIVLDLDKLAKEYETDDLKIIFSKRISKKINKSKIIIHAKEQSFNYDAVYEKKPIELDINV